MSEDANKKSEGAGRGRGGAPEAVGEDDPTGRSEDRSGISDFVRRAVSAGVGAASRSKDDIMRVAAGEMRSWLEHLNLHEELAKALAKMVIEVEDRDPLSPHRGRQAGPRDDQRREDEIAGKCSEPTRGSESRMTRPAKPAASTRRFFGG